MLHSDNMPIEIYQKLLEARCRSGQCVFIPVFNDRKGHPILVKSDLVKELLVEPDDSNLRKFINRKGFKAVEVDDDAILQATSFLLRDQKLVVEFSGAATVAAIRSGVVDVEGRKVGAMISGGNLDPSLMAQL